VPTGNLTPTTKGCDRCWTSLPSVPRGRDLPNDCNVVIEIPMRADPIKYEVDKETGAVFVDRFMSTAMHYPWIAHFFEHYKDASPGMGDEGVTNAL
jgi:inorganic pyrophosphatase